MTAQAAKKAVLVIVESPSKAKTIEKFLGKDYSVLATMGHLIDLPKSRLGIDVEGGFEPEYRTVRGRAKLLKEIQQAARRSRLVLLASDNDREGEALAWQLRKVLQDSLPELPIQRIVFNEITPQAIREAVKHPGSVDEGMARAQKARRVLDRLVGYHLSPLLWKKLKSGLSAGRVQSAALRLVCDREALVETFVPEEYWTIEADFRKGRRKFSGELAGSGAAGLGADAEEGTGARFGRRLEAEAVMAALAAPQARVSEVWEFDSKVRPRPPLTTSGLLQAGSILFGFSSAKTMLVAQQLYEGVKVGRAKLGLITYMRTDSARLSQAALDEVRAWIAGHYPAELPEFPNGFRTPGRSRGSHEAIRPTRVSLDPEELTAWLTKDQHKLYVLIWESLVASQMNPAKVRTLRIEAKAGAGSYLLSFTQVVEEGFRKVLKVSGPRADRAASPVPELKVGEALSLVGLRTVRHLGQGPCRYNDASLIRALEEDGLGRPSTYAPIITHLLERYYVVREGGELRPTALGRAINDLLVEAFPDILDLGFTADMETRLDEVEEDGANWVDLIQGFYGPFKRRYDDVMVGLESRRGSLDAPTNETCELCGKAMVRKIGRFGFFLACSGFPTCKNTRPLPLGTCPRCGQGKIVARRKALGRGREFFGCTRYPECDFVSWYRPSKAICPGCGDFLVEKHSKKRGTFKACVNPNCDRLHSREEEAING